ncbi:MAG: hypothetical protein OEY11_13350 [Gammaproteobacteria bacterium]|nr:hypothetical protein [Gammaproteobacteria bacterium]
MNIQKILLIFILSTSLWGCFHDDDDNGNNASGFNADINGHWTLTTTITSSPCYPSEVGISFTDTIVISEVAGAIYVDGILDPDASYSNGVLHVDFVESITGYNYQYTMNLTFSDNNHASGSSSSTETYFGVTCSWTESITLTRL